jgi:hypothetical protein
LEEFLTYFILHSMQPLVKPPHRLAVQKGRQQLESRFAGKAPRGLWTVSQELIDAFGRRGLGETRGLEEARK